MSDDDRYVDRYEEELEDAIGDLELECEQFEAERDEARAAARILLDDLSQFTRVEWLLERWPWLKEPSE